MLTGNKTFQISTRALAKRLPELHESVFRSLSLLLPDDLGRSDCMVSSIEGVPDLYMLVMERHPYTTFLRLTYVLGEDGAQNPNAHIRVYHDARMAEATAFSPQQGIRRLAGPGMPSRGIVERSWRLNRALVKWLDYVLGQGHSQASMKRLDSVPGFLARPGIDSTENSGAVFDTG